MARILIEGGYIVSIGVRDHVIEDGIVAIVDDRIHYIGERSNFDASASNAEKTIPAKDRAVLPGLINTHIHLIGAHLKGVTMSHTRYHVAKRGYFLPMEKAYPKSINMSLGSDWCSNDLWQYMKLAILVPRTITGNVELLSGWDALEMATMGGARSLGMADEIGSLEAGKKADIILMEISRPSFRPIRAENLCSNLVYNATGTDVSDVYVDENPIVKDRGVMTIDRAEMNREVQHRAEAIWARAEKNF